MTTTPLPPPDILHNVGDFQCPECRSIVRVLGPIQMGYTAEQVHQASADLEAENQRLREALNDAATSLETIRHHNFGEDGFIEARMFAQSRATVARAALENKP